MSASIALPRVRPPRGSGRLPWGSPAVYFIALVVIALMLGGTAVCVTSIVLTWRVLARNIAAVVRARFIPVNEDLAGSPVQPVSTNSDAALESTCRAD